MGARTKASADVRTLPVIEIFGPTIQGEGAEAGLPCNFIRVGGCDYRCTWCDSMYAVDPAEVRANAEHLTVNEITSRLRTLAGNPPWVVVSGGNPALLQLGPLVSALQDDGRKVAIETQGSSWKPWLGAVDRLTVSPKAPSSAMDTERHRSQFERFMESAQVVNADGLVLKIVCFDEIDLGWAREISSHWPSVPLFLSAGTPVPSPPNLLAAVAARFRWLSETVANDPTLARARVLPQLHVVAWGDARGV
jgi:7-carboxy-7-deazaguanine synthase